jgi:hypothetical protein
MAQSSTAPSDPSLSDSEASSDGAATANPVVGYGRRMVHGLIEILDLQVQIIILRLLARARDAFFVLLLGFCAAAAGVVGLVFLYIFIYRELSSVLSTLWVDLIFAGFHLLLALILFRVVVDFCCKAMQQSESNGGGEESNP